MKITHPDDIRDRARKAILEDLRRFRDLDYDPYRTDLAQALQMRVGSLDRRWKGAREIADASAESGPAVRCSTDGGRPGSERGAGEERSDEDAGPRAAEVLDGLRAMHPDVPDAAWTEFRQCAIYRIWLQQAWVQCAACGWPIDAFRPFHASYRDYGMALLREIGLQEWPITDGIPAPWDGCWVGTYLAMGRGKYLDLSNADVMAGGNASIVECLPCVYVPMRAGTELPTGRLRRFDGISQIQKFEKSEAIKRVPVGARAVTPIAGVNFRAWIEFEGNGSKEKLAR